MYKRIYIFKRGVFILPFFLFLFFFNPTFTYSQKTSVCDTVSLSLFQYVNFSSNNGSTCLYNVRNSNNADIAIIINMGAPDSLRLDDNSLFNGIHYMQPGAQLITIGDFMGKQISVTNLSKKAIPVTVMLYCPN